MYGLLSKAMDRIDGSLQVLDKEEKEGKEGKGGVNFLGQQMYQLAIAFAALRKEERESAAKPLASDSMSEADMKAMVGEIFTCEELEEMLASKQREKYDNHEDKSESEEVNGKGE
jgi:hypothetical protein